MKDSRRFLACWVALIALLTLPAGAVDLGGNCCADLEQRVAELEQQWALLHPGSDGHQLLLRILPLGAGSSFGEAVTRSSDFAHQLLSCRSNGASDDHERFIREGQCVWTRARVYEDDNDTGPRAKHYHVGGTIYSAGIQIGLGQHWFLGAGIGFEEAQLDALNGNETTTHQLDLGAVLKYNPGPWLFAASLTGLFGHQDNEAHVNPGVSKIIASSDADIRTISGNLTAAYVADLGGLYLKPQVNAAMAQVTRDSYRQSPVFGQVLTVYGQSETVVSVSPAVELGTELSNSAGFIRPYIRAGVTWRDDADFLIESSFTKISPKHFGIHTSIDRTVADLALGIDFIDPLGITLKLEYDSQAGATTFGQAGSAKLSVPF